MPHGLKKQRLNIFLIKEEVEIGQVLRDALIALNGVANCGQHVVLSERGNKMRLSRTNGPRQWEGI